MGSNHSRDSGHSKNDSSSRKRHGDDVNADDDNKPKAVPLPTFDLGSGFRLMHVPCLARLSLGDGTWGAAGIQQQKKKDDDGTEDAAPACAEEEPPQPEFARLQAERTAFLCKVLPAELRERWTLVYASSVNGASYKRFQHHITNAGECLIVIRTTTGACFGGRVCNFPKEAHPEWVAADKGTQFVFAFNGAGGVAGDADAQIAPMGGDSPASPPGWNVWRATGLNDHYQWMNSDTETLFNGVGMGGQLEYFAWCIDKSFEKGHCRGAKSTTFGNPPLHTFAMGTAAAAGDHGEFEVAHVEVWSMKDAVLDAYDMERELARRGLEGKSGSILRNENNADKVIKGYLHDFASHLAAGGTAETNMGADGEVLLIQ